MSKLDDDVIREIAPILERYRAELFRDRRFSTTTFEVEVRDAWQANYKGVKDLVTAVSRHGRYQEVAAYYMEHNNPAGPQSEFKLRLAELYGVRSYHHSPEMELKRDQFWARSFEEE